MFVVKSVRFDQVLVMVLYQYAIEFRGGSDQNLTFFSDFLEMLSSCQQSVLECQERGEVDIVINIESFWFGFDGSWPALRVRPLYG